MTGVPGRRKLNASLPFLSLSLHTLEGSAKQIAPLFRYAKLRESRGKCPMSAAWCFNSIQRLRGFGRYLSVSAHSSLSAGSSSRLQETNLWCLSVKIRWRGQDNPCQHSTRRGGWLSSFPVQRKLSSLLPFTTCCGRPVFELPGCFLQSKKSRTHMAPPGLSHLSRATMTESSIDSRSRKVAHPLRDDDVGLLSQRRSSVYRALAHTQQ